MIDFDPAEDGHSKNQPWDIESHRIAILHHPCRQVTIQKAVCAHLIWELCGLGDVEWPPNPSSLIDTSPQVSSRGL